MTVKVSIQFQCDECNLGDVTFLQGNDAMNVDEIILPDGWIMCQRPHDDQVLYFHNQGCLKKWLKKNGEPGEYEDYITKHWTA